MPTYTFNCENCSQVFELYLTISEYSVKQKCPSCNSSKIIRDYLSDCSTISTSVKKSDSELKTLGDLANRNRDRMTEDQKQNLNRKHNEYKDTGSQKELPKGMTRLEKGTKIKWTDNQTTKKKRSI